MKSDNLYETYNARWKDPEEVAKTFVPLVHFIKLAANDHSVLMGPRGCGKTTLLKMLTRRALRTWARSERSERFSEDFKYPDFEAVYIPTDIRWIYETNSIDNLTIFDSPTKKKIQRILSTISVLENVSNTFMCMLEDLDLENGKKEEIETNYCKKIIEVWNMYKTIPSFEDIKTQADIIALETRGKINEQNRTSMRAYLRNYPSSYYSHVLDTPIFCCKLISNLLPREKAPHRWGICFDELELAPTWMREELLTCIRSVDPQFFIKLTWFPILPSAASIPEPGHDFSAIKLWSSSFQEPFKFCDKIASDFIQERLRKQSISLKEILGTSLLASSHKADDGSVYGRGSKVYEIIKKNAKKDESLSHYLRKFDINPDDPVPSSIREKKERQLDQFFRKAKPILLLRNEVLKGRSQARSRKRILLYSGLEVFYGISEGNPRWLIGLLTDLFEKYRPVHKDLRNYQISKRTQSEIIDSASHRFLSLIKTTPIVADNESPSGYFSLGDLVETIAELFRASIYNKHFNLDPIGSIEIGGDISNQKKSIIMRALEKGVFIHVGKTEIDAPAKITGERFRLSFMVCPNYHLPLRNYRSIVITPERIRKATREVLRREKHILGQLILDFEKDEDKSN